MIFIIIIMLSYLLLLNIIKYDLSLKFKNNIILFHNK